MLFSDAVILSEAVFIRRSEGSPASLTFVGVLRFPAARMYLLRISPALLVKMRGNGMTTGMV